MRLNRNVWLGLFVLLLVGSALQTDFKLGVLLSGLPNLRTIIVEMMQVDINQVSVAFLAVIETIEMAVLGTTMGFALAVPLSVLASRNLMPPILSVPIRFILTVVRTIPSLLWALIFVVVIGLGPTAGILALTMYSLGFLGKMFYEIFESQNPEAYEALTATGATKLQLIRFVTIPEAAPYVLSQFLFMFEYNVRASTILGFVGAGGVGFYIYWYLQILEYGKAFTFILIVLAAVLMIDWLSMKIRLRYVPKNIVTR